MNVQNSSADQTRHAVSRVAEADSSFSRIGLLASLGFAGLLLVSAPALAATAPPLGVAQQFGVLGAAAVTGGGGGGTINGDVGSYATPSITGFPPYLTTPPFIVHRSADAVVQQAQADASAAYGNLAGQGGPLQIDALAGRTFAPGAYTINDPLLGNGETLTLTDPSPGKTGIFVFNVTNSMTTIAGSIIAGDANPCNIYWRVGASATLGDNFWGTVIANVTISMPTAGKSLNGRAVALTGAVTMADANNVGGCSAPVTPVAIVEPGGGQVGLSKEFFPSTISAGGVSRIGITLMNNTGAAFTTTVPLTDTLLGGLVVALVPAVSTDCGVGVIAVPGTGTVTLAAGASIPGAIAPIISSCTVMVNVTAPVGGSYPNTLPTGALTNGVISNPAPANATLTILSLIASGIPTLSEWAMILLASLLAIVGFAAMRRQSR